MLSEEAPQSTKNPDFWEDGNFHWTSPKDLSGKQDKILLATDRKITDAGLKKISSGLLPIDTVLLSSRSGPLMVDIWLWR